MQVFMLEKENVYKMVPMTLRYLTQNSFISLYSSPNKNLFQIPCKSCWLYPPQEYGGKPVNNCGTVPGNGGKPVLCTQSRIISYTNTHHHNWVRLFFILNKLGRPKNKKDKNNLNIMITNQIILLLWKL